MYVCVYMCGYTWYILFSLFICQWILRLLPCLHYSIVYKTGVNIRMQISLWDSYFIAFNKIALYIYIKQWDSWIALFLIFWEISIFFSLWLYQFRALPLCTSCLLYLIIPSTFCLFCFENYYPKRCEIEALSDFNLFLWWIVIEYFFFYLFAICSLL